MAGLGLTDHAVQRFQERADGVPADLDEARDEMRRRLARSPLVRSRLPPPGTRVRKHEEGDLFVWQADGKLLMPVVVDAGKRRPFVVKTVIDRFAPDDREPVASAAAPAWRPPPPDGPPPPPWRPSPSPPRPVRRPVPVGRLAWTAAGVALLVWLGPKVLGVAGDVVGAVDRWFEEAEREAYLQNNHVPGPLRDSCSSVDSPAGASAALRCGRGGVVVTYYAFGDAARLRRHFALRLRLARRRHRLVPAAEGGCVRPGHVVRYASRDGSMEGRAFCVAGRPRQARIEWYDEHSEVYAVTRGARRYERLYEWWLTGAGPAYDAEGKAARKRR